MSAAATQTALQVERVPSRLSAKLTPAYLPLAERLNQIRAESTGSSVFVFTSITGGEGVSHIVRNLAPDLRVYTGETVCTTEAHALDFQGSAGNRTTQLEGLRREHAYVLVDCPALRQSSEALLIGKASTGAILVVEADRNTRDSIVSAENILARHGVPLAGYVLNKRTYPIPNFIYRWL